MAQNGDAVKVAVRVRPFKDYEIEGKSKCIVQMNGPQTILTEPGTGKEYKFSFDFSYWSFDKNDSNFANNQTLWNDLGESMLNNCWSGFNTCMFAYGQTGSGKSYSMIGYPGLDEGLVIKAGSRIFQRIEETKTQNQVGIEYTVEASMLEIYNEEVRDLFNPKNGTGLKIRENPQRGVYVDGLSKHLVRNYEEISKLLEQGDKARTTGATAMNKTSSRAHTVFIMTFKQIVTDSANQQKFEKVSNINLVDLAGSERMARTGATGARAQEGININLSLTCLGNVIKALADKCTGKNPNLFVPYRDSKLTYLLKESLGGNSKTIMIAAISPADVNFDETLSTLRYADRAKSIVNKAVVNEDSASRIISQLKLEIEQLKAQLSQQNGGVVTTNGSVPNGMPGVDNSEYEKLKDQLEESQKYINELQMTTEEKIKQTEELTKSRDEFLKEMNIDVSFDKTNQIHITNINEDPLLSGKICFGVNNGVSVGMAPTNSIKISGVGVVENHAVFSVQNNSVFLTPNTGAKTFVNGKEITIQTELNNGDRIVFGNHLMYQLLNPKQGPCTLCDYKVAVEELGKALYGEKAEQLIKEHKKRELELESTIQQIREEINKQRQEQKDQIQKEIELATQRESQIQAEYSKKETLLLQELQIAKNDEQRRKQIEEMLEREKKKNEEQLLDYQKRLEDSKLTISSTYQKQIMELETKLLSEVHSSKKRKEDLERENEALQQRIKEKEMEFEKRRAEEEDYLRKKEQQLLREQAEREIEITKLIAENQHNTQLVQIYEEQLKTEKTRIESLIIVQKETFIKTEEKIREQISSEVQVLKEKLEKSKAIEEELKKTKEQAIILEDELRKKQIEHEEMISKEREKFSLREKELIESIIIKERVIKEKIDSSTNEEEINNLKQQLALEKQEKQKLLETEREEYEKALRENKLKMTAVRAIFKAQVLKSNNVAIEAKTKQEEQFAKLQQQYLKEKIAKQEELDREREIIEKQKEEQLRLITAKQNEILFNNQMLAVEAEEKVKAIQREKDEKEKEFERKELELKQKLFELNNRLQEEISEKTNIIIENAVKKTTKISSKEENTVAYIIPLIQEANTISEELRESISFDLKLVGTTVAVEVKNTNGNYEDVWTIDKFESKLHEIRTWYHSRKNSEIQQLNNQVDPYNFIHVSVISQQVQPVINVVNEDVELLKERIRQLEYTNNQMNQEKLQIMTDLNRTKSENDSLKMEIGNLKSKHKGGYKEYKKLFKAIKKLETSLNSKELVKVINKTDPNALKELQDLMSSLSTENTYKSYGTIPVRNDTIYPNPYLPSTVTNPYVPNTSPVTSNLYPYPQQYQQQQYQYQYTQQYPMQPIMQPPMPTVSVSNVVISYDSDSSSDYSSDDGFDYMVKKLAKAARKGKLEKKIEKIEKKVEKKIAKKGQKKMGNESGVCNIQ
ncbi:hypothetical protein ABK040_005188 [Willaertia magna]